MSDNTTIQKSDNANAIDVPQQQRAEQAQYYTPLVDVAENDDGFLFQADLPGARAGDVDVSYDNGTLTIQARVQPRRPADHPYVWREYGVGHFYRQFTLRTPVDADGIRAQLKDGVLDLFVPKASTAKPRRIEVQSA